MRKGKDMRHIKIHSVKEIDEDYFTELVKHASSLKPRKIIFPAPRPLLSES